MLGFDESIGVRPTLSESIEKARLNANREAADTGSTVMAVLSVELGSQLVRLVGQIGTSSLEIDKRSDSGGRVSIAPRGMGGFHTTAAPGSIPQGIIGFLVLHQPLQLTGGRPIEESDRVWVSVEIRRCTDAIPWNTIIGPVCCAVCNNPIPTIRLKAIRGARLCTQCQQAKEEAIHDYRF